MMRIPPNYEDKGVTVRKITADDYKQAVISRVKLGVDKIKTFSNLWFYLILIIVATAKEITLFWGASLVISVITFCLITLFNNPNIKEYLLSKRKQNGRSRK